MRSIPLPTSLFSEQSRGLIMIFRYWVQPHDYTTARTVNCFYFVVNYLLNEYVTSIVVERFSPLKLGDLKVSTETFIIEKTSILHRLLLFCHQITRLQQVNRSEFIPLERIMEITQLYILSALFGSRSDKDYIHYRIVRGSPLRIKKVNKTDVGKYPVTKQI